MNNLLSFYHLFPLYYFFSLNHLFTLNHLPLNYFSLSTTSPSQLLLPLNYFSPSTISSPSPNPSPSTISYLSVPTQFTLFS